MRVWGFGVKSSTPLAPTCYYKGPLDELGTVCSLQPARDFTFRWRSARASTRLQHFEDVFATQVCQAESGWRQCSESCCQTAGVHVELARGAWTVHAQTVPRRAGKPAVRKPTHARLVCLVKPIPFPCFQSSSGCIESPTSLRKNQYKNRSPM